MVFGGIFDIAFVLILTSQRILAKNRMLMTYLFTEKLSRTVNHTIYPPKLSLVFCYFRLRLYHLFWCQIKDLHFSEVYVQLRRY